MPQIVSQGIWKYIHSSGHSEVFFIVSDLTPYFPRFLSLNINELTSSGWLLLAFYGFTSSAPWLHNEIFHQTAAFIHKNDYQIKKFQYFKLAHFCIISNHPDDVISFVFKPKYLGKYGVKSEQMNIASLCPLKWIYF